MLIDVVEQFFETNLQKTILPNIKESALNFFGVCFKSASHDKPKQVLNINEMKICLSNTTYELREDA